MIFPDSALAHRYLDGLAGIEIGASAHNPFNIVGEYRNVDATDAMDTVFKLEELRMCGKASEVDIASDASHLPLFSQSVDYVLSSHVLEHIHNPIAALIEWQRVARHFIFIIVPQPTALESDRTLPLTTAEEVLSRNINRGPCDHLPGQHCSRWTSETLAATIRLLHGFNVVEVQDPDDKVGNGFAIVIRLCPLTCTEHA